LRFGDTVQKVVGFVSCGHTEYAQRLHFNRFNLFTNFYVASLSHLSNLVPPT